MYLRYHIDDRELETKSYAKFCPKRKVRPGQFPKFTANGTTRDTKKRRQAWVFPKKAPEPSIVRDMFCEAIGCMIRKTMTLHDFSFDGKIYRQKSGGAIGMDLTGVLADIYLCRWDTILKEKMNEDNIICRVYKRFKDDVTALTREEINHGQIQQGDIENEIENQPENNQNGKRIVTRLIGLADEIDENLQSTGDCCENYPDKRLPTLDLKVWVGKTEDGKWVIRHEHYMKDVASRMVINKGSSHGERMKENVNVNECMRIIGNCGGFSGDDGQTERKHISHYMKRMQYSGYSERDRLSVLKKAYDKKEKRNDSTDCGKRKGRNKDWYLKGNKYESLMVVDATPGERLKRVVEKIAKKYGIKMKVIERRGRTMKTMFQKSNPFGVVGCSERDCVICKGGMGVDCRKRGVVYEIGCEEEGCGKKYIGQTGRTLYERLKQHEQIVGNRGNRGPMGPVEKHREEHRNRDFKYSVRIKDNLYGRATRRMISEAVQIESLDKNISFNRKQGWTFASMYRERDYSNDGFGEDLVEEIEYLI